MAEPVDDHLVRAAQAGDRRALEDLLRSHQDHIHALARRLMGNPTDALDATQEAMISIVRGLPKFNGRSAFSTWVYRITTNACLDELRRRSRRPTHPLPDYEQAGRPSVTGGGSAEADPAEVVPGRLDLDTALANLPVEFRIAVVLRDVCRLDYAEIADVLGIPPGTVRSRIARGRAALARTLAPDTMAPEDLAPGNQTPSSERPIQSP